METNSNQSEFKDIKPSPTPEKPANFYDAEYFSEINHIEGFVELLGTKATDHNIDEDYDDEEEGFFVQKKYCMESWYEFDDAIFYAAENFYDEYGFFPNMVVMNNFTHNQINWLTSISPKRKFLTNDDNEERIEIRVFEYSDCILQVATTPDTEDLKNMEFYIVYDEDNGDDNDDEDDEPDLPVGGPVKMNNIIESYHEVF